MDYQGHVSQAPSWVVSNVTGSTRLDTFIRRCLPHLSRRVVQQEVSEGKFCVNGLPGRKGTMLFNGDTLGYTGDPDLLAQVPPADWGTGASIHYEDESILIVHKPAEMATHGFSGREKNTVANFLMAIRPSLWSVGKSRWEPGIVHRLDQGTSGLILIAKDQEAFERLRFQFERGLVRKRYWALVWGKTRSGGEITLPLSHDPANRRKMRGVPELDDQRIRLKKWRALTRFHTVSHGGEFSFIRVEIETGVTHQIRAHLQAIGHPLVGDPLYAGNRPDPPGVRHQFLHAYYLGFSHPGTGESVVFESCLPTELERILDCLKIHR